MKQLEKHCLTWYLCTCKMLILSYSRSTINTATSNSANTVQSPNKGEGPFPDFAIFGVGGPSYFGEKCDDYGEN